MLMFYETKMDDYFRRQTADVWQLESCDDYCVVISQVNEIGGAVRIVEDGKNLYFSTKWRSAIPLEPPLTAII